jgi:DNA-binding transcriptional LysR family regulator
MAKSIDWESRIGRRIHLRDLHIFFAVSQRGSMAKAAAQLGITQPSVSQVISDLEHALGVKLFDRSPRGVETTKYGRVLLKRAQAAFDELRQGVRDMEFLADPSVGEVKMGCPESIAAAFLPPVMRDFLQDHPGIAVHVEQVVTPTLELAALHARELDFVIARLVKPVAEDQFGDDLDVEVLFNDELVLAAGAHTKWVRRRKLSFSELADARWILTPQDTWNMSLVQEMFRAEGLGKPKISVTTFSVHMRTHLMAMGDFVTAMPKSVFDLNAARFGLKALPLQVAARPWPIAIVMLKNRTLSPVVEMFLEELRKHTRREIAAQAPKRGRRS